jgi:hypothetical protein
MLPTNDQGAAKLIDPDIFLIWGHEGQQKNIDATGSFTYHAIYSDCPVAVLHTRLHVSETL